VARVVIYLTASCGYCHAAQRLLEKKGIRDIERIRVDLDPARRAEMRERSGRTSVPQIWIDGRHVGGYDELYELAHEGGLEPLLEPERT
jgi:glutaredoxin 3